MHRIVGAALLAVGVILLIWGIDASDAVASEISEFFTGEPTDRAKWLIVGGVAATAAGLMALVIPGRRAGHKGA